MSASSSAANSSLRPAWSRGNQSGRGFQPPPTVASERGRSQSIGNNTTDAATTGGPGNNSNNPNSSRRDSNLNAFAALDDDDDAIVGAAPTAAQVIAAAHAKSEAGGGDHGSKQQPVLAKSNSRSEALRAAGSGGGGGRSMSTKVPGGRSLADLAAGVPEQRTINRGRFLSLRSTGDSGAVSGSASGSGAGGGGAGGGAGGGGGNEGQFSYAKAASSASAAAAAADAKVIRYTREKLLSMRPAPAKTPPPCMKVLEGTSILADTSQDPVCWDVLDSEEIWAAVVPRRTSALKPGGVSSGVSATNITAGTGMPEAEIRRVSARSNSGAAGSSGRWQRGVALPPPDQAKKGRDKDANSPNELWDDPNTSGTATDFSAFGSMPMDDNDANNDNYSSHNNSASGDVFDFDKMAEATRKFEEELHGGTRSRTSSNAEEDELGVPAVVKVDPKRPLATIGTTIRSGSGDDVNVFEDFDDPGAVSEEEKQESSSVVDNNSDKEDRPAIRGADEDQNASSRLMAMIGVKREVEPVATTAAASAASTIGSQSPGAEKNVASPWGDASPKAPPLAGAEGLAIPLNPWGTPMVPTTTQNEVQGLNIQAQLQAAAAEEEEKKRRQQHAEELRRRQLEQEEGQRRLAAQQQQQQQEAEHARQQAAQQQHQAGVQSQVELVLLERISTILEGSWGRADLLSILSTLHSEDPRVIPLIGNVDALRALILRNQRRIVLRHEPAFGTEMAILVLTNTQWQQQQQQQQQQEAQARAQQQQQEELRLRHQQAERQRQLEAEQQRKAAAAAARQQAEHQQQLLMASISPTAPWYYSDPQNNVQGPFRGNEMRQWLEAGYFKGDLPISQQTGGPFRPLSTIFPNLSVAFLPADNSAETARAKAEEEETERREQAERAAQAEAEAKAQAAERERQAQGAAAAKAEQERLMARELERAQPEKDAAAKNSNGGNESSTQLKLMLGLPSEQQESTATPSENIPEPPAPKVNSKRSAKASGKNAASQQRSSAKEIQPASEASASSASSATPATAWGGAVKPVSRKSMSEIQKEEARASAVLAMQREGSRSSSGWANVAAARPSSTAWSGGNVKPPSAAAVIAGTGGPVAPVEAATTARPQQQRQQKQPNASAKQNRSNSAVSASAAQEFGATMSPMLEKWCKDQMTKLNGSDDLTLVSYCMTLTDPAEIRQYLALYLGSTPSVNNFATEFINKRGLGGVVHQEEWETTAAAKKSRKKKSGGR